MADFGAQMDSILAKYVSKVDQVVQGSVVAFASDVITLSPVGNPALWKHPAPADYRPGAFVANWQYGAGSAPSGTLDARDPGKGATVAKIASAVEAQGAAQRTHYLANNLPYGPVLEFGNHSKQVPPGGMVGLTVQRWPEIVAETVAAVNS